MNILRYPYRYVDDVYKKSLLTPFQHAHNAAMDVHKGDPRVGLFLPTDIVRIWLLTHAAGVASTF